MGRDMLRAAVYAHDKEDIVFTQEYPYRQMSIWVSHDDDCGEGHDGGDFSYDINIRDEDGNDRYEAWEAGRIPTEFEALRTMEDNIAAHPEVHWMRCISKQGRKALRKSLRKSIPACAKGL